MLITFGDIFRYQDREFVFLAVINGVTYAAMILDPELSRELFARRASAAKGRNPKANREERYATAYCFVMLTTPPFDNRAANIGLSDKHGVNMDQHEHLMAVCDEDLEALKAEILESKGVPIALREYVQALTNGSASPAP